MDIYQEFNRLVSGFGTETLYIPYLFSGCVLFCDVANTSLMTQYGNQEYKRREPF
jgi:hypothetical protein